MGCDGGTIPKRDELVKTKKKPEQKDKASELAHRWQNCAISQAPLQQPVVACELGRLYSKETVLETLLDKSAAVAEPATSSSADVSVAAHINSLRDVKALNLTENPAWSEAATAEKGDGYIDMQKSKWICPVSGQEMNGRFRFVFLWSCGCVVSEKALKELTKTKKEAPFECLKCQKPFELLDVILLNPVEAEDISAAQEKMETRRSKAKAAKDLKKSKKKQKSSDEESEQVSKEAVNGDSSSMDPVASKVDAEAGSSLKLEKRKLEKNPTVAQANESNGVKKLKSAKSSDPVTKLVSYSVAKDPKASSTYKSLFTSSEKAKDQQRAHWVTYNPFYN